MVERRVLGAIALVLACAVAGCAADAPPVDTLAPSRKARVAFTDYAIAGAHLFLHQDLGDAQCNDCESRSYVEGESLLGEPLTTVKLFQMCGRLEPAELARRAMDILLSRVGQPVLDKPESGDACHGDERVCSLVAPPKIDGDTLSFWIHEGEMNPALVFVEVDLTTADVKRTRGADVAAATRSDAAPAASSSSPAGPGAPPGK